MARTYPNYKGLLEQQLSDIGITPLKVLIVAQDPTVTANVLFKNAQLSDIGSKLDARGIAADMLREFRVLNTITQVDVLALKEAASTVAAVGNFTFDGTATASATLTFYISKYQGGNSTDNRDGTTFPITVATGDTDAVVAGKLTAAIQAAGVTNLYSLVAQANTKMVEAAAVCGGESGNEMFFGYDGMVPGLTVTCNLTTEGSTNPAITVEELNTLLNNLRHQRVVVQAGLDPTPFVKFVSAREEANLQDLSEILILGKSDGKQQLITYVKSVNSHLATAVGCNSVTKSSWIGPVFGIPTFTQQAAFAAEMTLRNTDGANISTIMSNQFAQIGGLQIMPLPYFNTRMTNMASPHPELNFSSQDIIDLNEAGFMSFDYDDVANQVIMSKGVTCTDVSLGERFHSLNNVEIAITAREIIANNFLLQYNQVNMYSGKNKTFLTQVTQKDILVFGIGMYNYLVDNGLIDDGPDYHKAFIDKFQSTLIFDVPNNYVKMVFLIKPLAALEAFEIDVIVAI